MDGIRNGSAYAEMKRRQGIEKNGRPGNKELAFDSLPREIHLRVKSGHHKSIQHVISTGKKEFYSRNKSIDMQPKHDVK